MPHPFEVRKEIEIKGDPEAVWEAIATGAGIDGWFLGTGNTVEPVEGGRVHVSFGAAGSAESTVTGWDPPHRFAHRGDAAPDGSLHAFEYTIEGRGGTTVVRLVHSGFLADDWEAEYESLNEGDFMYLHQLAQYVERFRGRTPIAVTVWQPHTAGRDAALADLRRALGLDSDPAEGDRVAIEVDGAAIDGVVDFLSQSIIGIRTDDGLYRFLHSPQGVVYAGHHIYRDDLDPGAAEQAWTAWLQRSVG
jgi:uncharacterized protein YndB with AHSA1/START domain